MSMDLRPLTGSGRVEMKKTKIVATISDLNCSEEFIRKLYENGMNVVRLNSAHQSLDGSLKIVEAVRAVSHRIAVMMDTKGPEIRTAMLPEPVQVKEGQHVRLSGYPEECSDDCIGVTCREFAGSVPAGSRVLIDDGLIELKALERDGNTLVCTVMNGGVIHGKKSVNVPNVHIDLPSVSEKDIEYIDFAVRNRLDFIAHSFVRTRRDVEAVKEILNRSGSSIRVIAKIENQSGVENIEEILEEAYGVMVARGDLAIEIPFEKVPGIQKMLINRCIEKRKPVIIATQMLHSMIQNPRPTRAEVSDVANAIYSQTDAVMLSGETAVGKYPVEAVKTMNAIACEVEKGKAPMNDIPVVVINNDTSAFLIKSAVQGAVQLNARAVVADTTSGRTIRSLAAYRGNRTIYAQCYRRETVRQLALSYGVSARYMEPGQLTHEFVGNALNQLREHGLLESGDMVVIVAGNFGRSKGVSFVEIGSVENLAEASGKR